MKVLNLCLIVLLFLIFSCGSTEKKHFWVRITVLKELNYHELTVNNINLEQNKKNQEEFVQEHHYTDDDMFQLSVELEFWDIFFLKFDKDTNVNELTKEVIEIKSGKKLIWKGNVYDENAFSSCGFYQMKDEPYKDQIRAINLYFNAIENNQLKLEDRYYIMSDSRLVCTVHDENNKTEEVMLAVNIANNSFQSNPILSINGLQVDNGIQNNYFWKNFRKLIEKSGFSPYRYSENQDGFAKTSGYWSFKVQRNTLSDYSFDFLSKNNENTNIYLRNIEFCSVPEEKSYQELINEFKVLTYGFTLKNGIPFLEFQGAIDHKNNIVNCSKTSNVTSGVVVSSSGLLIDSYAEVQIKRVNGEPYSYVFEGAKIGLDYIKRGGDPDEYKKHGFKRWHFFVEVPFSKEKGFSLGVPWHFVKEDENIHWNSKDVARWPETEQIFNRSIFYNKDYPTQFENGFPIISNGDYQEFDLYFSKIPLFYGDSLEFNFHFITKNSEEIILDYEGSVKGHYYGEDIFDCFNEEHLWNCPMNGFEDNFSWLNE